jgi:hypothetical protein
MVRIPEASSRPAEVRVRCANRYRARVARCRIRFRLEGIVGVRYELEVAGRSTGGRQTYRATVPDTVLRLQIRDDAGNAVENQRYELRSDGLRRRGHVAARAPRRFP